ncbi:hypothetical protein [Magnetospirillum sp. SS-4]|uniref:hypothetical protein n=1 Tax=Magnetospirillum sp. SS-4 TaxID=2681465 RepID=UPI0013858790|nr:hypothetical protein [Magnetospirillum sp. SS-4]CAA7612764.1 hypothetical protein MTBSS4_10291 [Magnetospirillum sp. SS-4]
MPDHIQVGDAVPRAQYVANGSQTAFTFLFPIFTAADMDVWLDAARQSPPAYSISGIGVSAGGSVLFATPPADGVLVTLRRRLAIARTGDYQEDGIIRAKVLNDELDYQTAAIQQVAEEAGRAVRRSLVSPGTADLTLPEPEAGKAIGWNAAGDGLANDPAGFAATVITVTSQAAAAAASASAAAASAASLPNGPVTGTGKVPLWNGSAWVGIDAGTGDMVGANNLADVADAVAARGNLGAAAASHGHTSADITDFTEAAQDVVEAMVAAAGGGGGGWTHVGTASPSGATVVDFTGLEAGHDYMIEYSDVFSSATDWWAFRYSTDNGASFSTSSYRYKAVVWDSGSGSALTEAATANALHFGLWGPDYPAAGHIVIANPAQNTHTVGYGQGAGHNHAGIFAGLRNTAETVNAVRIVNGSGYTVTGTFLLYKRARS